jgi:hypothetical protein
LISPDVEEIEGKFGAKVLELDENSGPSFLHGMHEFLDEFLGFGVGDTLMSETKI